jgi:hypothetical protein
MATVNLGRIKFVWKGNFDNATSYIVDDVVNFNGTSYICVAVTSAGQDPDNFSNLWEVMSSKGDQGEFGLKGNTGDQGIQGVKGDTGDQGIQGIQGIQGVKGDKGDTGDTGANGANGATGAQGAQGVKGDIPSHDWSGTSLRFQNADGTMGAYNNLKGDTGNTGQKGDKGDKGDTGNAGSAGSAGANGSAGVSMSISNGTLTFTTV